MKVIVSKNSVKLLEVTLLDDDLLNGGDIFIGREEDCHIILDDKKVSRYQASLQMVDSKLQIKNLSDSIAFSVDGVNCKTLNLSERSLVKISNYTLEFYQLDQLLFRQTQIVEPTAIESNAPTDDDMEITSITETEEDEATEVFDDSSDEFDETAVLEEIEDEAVDDEFENSDSDSDSISNSDSDENFDSEEKSEFDSEDDFSEDTFNDDAFSDEGGFSDDGFSDDGFGAEEDSNESTQVFQSFANFTLRLFGENAPFDRYKIDEAEIRIGRDKEKCQIFLDDPEVSGVHAIIKKNILSCTLEDLDSSNGTILNGERINKHELISGDEFLVGSTSFTVEVSSDIIEAERGRLMPVDDNQEVEVEEIVEEEVDFDEFTEESDSEFEVGEPEEKSFIKKIMKDPKKKRIAIFGIVGLLLLMILMPSDEPKPVKKTKKKISKNKKEDPKIKKLSPANREKAEQNYVLALAKYNAGEFYEAKEYIDKVVVISKDYKDTQTLIKRIAEEQEKLVRLKERELAEKNRLALQLEIAKLLERAKIAVKEKNVDVAEDYFSKILEKDPENIDIPSLKLEIESYKKEIARKKFEKERKEADRRNKVEALRPGKSLYIKGKWYQAIEALEKFSDIKGMDEDLLKEGTEMLFESKRKLLQIVNPLSSKARSFKEGQDLKQAYETYGNVLKYDPSNEEALNERDKIFDLLNQRSKKLYREALISESLSLFDKAKEKFQEVQQISPLNSEYYLKASKKLENYLE